ncbi:nucleotidyl transferase AbiEii/AbiGii toxin family protein [Kribbella sp. NPDC023855]|uniref:nucleotidyl transferase AbiEii/AbiGii toxin family protein n=1 Tax=Kribbella sp. NPDC023855 TaxID=3154698 RepID=UPI0033FAE040
MNPLQTRLATVGLRAVADDGFVLAGGYALRAHGFGERDSDDIDLFTNVLDPELFAKAVERLSVAYRADGLDVVVARQAPLFARLVVTAEDGTTAKADLGVDHRSHPPVELAVGPVLSEADAVSSKVGALYSRLEPRDLMDIQSVLDSGRYDTDALLTLADHREATPLDRPMLATQLLAASHLPPTGFERYGASPDLITRICETARSWGEQLAGDAADPRSKTIDS